MKYVKKIFPQSIKMQLPLSYAAIAFLATAALGLVLLLILHNYYLQRELDYLNGQADTVEIVTSYGMEMGISQEELKSQIQNLSFLSQTKIQLLDIDGEVLIESKIPGTPGEYEILPDLLESMAGVQLDLENKTVIREKDSNSLIIKIEEETDQSQSEVQSDQTETSYLNLNFGLDMISPDDNRRSKQFVLRAFPEGKGIPGGHIIISHGPAYGSQIINDVRRSWILAAIVAVIISFIAGVLISRKITRPLQDLAEVTGEMAAGNLTVRAQINNRNELGSLGKSFNKMAGSIEQTVSDLKCFVADAAHELNTPVTALRTYLEIAANQKETGAEGTLIDDAINQVIRLENLLDNLLDLYRLESKTYKDTMTEVSLTTLMAEIGELCASQAEQKNINFSLRIPTNELTLTGNPVYLQQAFLNILDNAVKFTPPGGSIILNLKHDGNTAIVTIEDTGIGIPETDLPLLFSRFHRGRNTSQYPGNGLGLVIAETIIEKHEGSIHVERMELGTRFIMELPVVEN